MVSEGPVIKGYDMRQLVPSMGTEENSLIHHVDKAGEVYIPFMRHESASPHSAGIQAMREASEKGLLFLYGTAKTVGLTRRIAEMLNEDDSDINATVEKAIEEIRQQ